MPREALYNAFTCREMTRNLSQKLIGEAIFYLRPVHHRLPLDTKVFKKRKL